MAEKSTIRIGCASGFWGDSTIATPQLIKGGALDYLVFDYLAEITMSIMARARAKDLAMGYAHDFVTQVMKDALPEIARQRIRVISNAGGVNPEACAAALRELIRQAGLKLHVATVTGDDLMHRVEEFRAAGLREMFSGAEMPKQFMSVNAYLGALPIASALEQGADIVITGRCVDSAVTLGACMHGLGWSPDDYDRLAAGSLAGHIIECGAQATGGLFTDWQLSNQWENIGYPIVEVSRDGSFVVTKPPGTGGLVSRGTVAEQMVYEIGDPQAYILPDVVCDFSQVEMEELRPDEVRVWGARGLPPTPTLKVSATWMDGHRVGLMITLGGIDAADKARKVADAVLKRCRGILKAKGAPDFTETSVEIVGAESSYGPHARVRSPREVVLKIAAKHPLPQPLALLLREATSSGTSMSPGISGMGGNRPKPSPVVRLFSFLVDRKSVVPEVELNGKRWPVPFRHGVPLRPPSRPHLPDASPTQAETREIPLVLIAWGRSGDKGNDANIGVIARRREYLPYLRRALTPEAVRDYFAFKIEGSVDRFDLPGIGALNFLLHDALGGGGIASLRTDPQGKAFAQMLLDMPIRVPEAVAADAERRSEALASGKAPMLT
jgi:hypothetical protein